MTTENSQSVVKFLIDLIIQPGSSLKLVPFINISVICLLVLLCAISYTAIDTIHIIVMALLSLGLLISVNWFYTEYTKVIQEQKSNDKKSD